MALVLLPLAGQVPAVADPSPSPTPTSVGARSEPELPVEISVTLLEPLAPRPGTALRVQGTVRNRGPDPLADVRVRLRLSGSRIVSRGALGRVATETGPFGNAVPGTEAKLTDLLPTDSFVAFDISTPVDDLELTTSGVYPFGVEARGRGSSGSLQAVGRVHTFLPFTARFAGYTPTRLAWLWPLVAPPARGPAGEFLDDSLAADMGPRGRLSMLVEAAADERRARGASGVPVTFAVDPALLQAAADMGAAYRVRLPNGGPAVPGTGGQVAGAWLTRLRTATSGAPVVSLPYADPDVTALVRAGLGDDVSHTVGPAGISAAGSFPAPCGPTTSAGRRTAC